MPTRRTPFTQTIFGTALGFLILLAVLSAAAYFLLMKEWEQTTGTERQVYGAIGTCDTSRDDVFINFSAPRVHLDSQTGTVRVTGVRGTAFEDCVVQNIQGPQDAVILTAAPLSEGNAGDLHILSAQESERARAVEEDRAQFLRTHVAGHITDRLHLEGTAVTVTVDQGPDGTWRHLLVIDLGDADVDQRGQAVDLVESLRQNETLIPADPVVVRATGWPEITL